MKLLLLTRYDRLGASSRIRYLQYLTYLQGKKIDVTISPLLSNRYIQALYGDGQRWQEVLKGYCHRLIALTSVYKYDLVIIEKELFPYFPAIFERLLNWFAVPYIVDYDDAWFYRYAHHRIRFLRILLGEKIDVVMRNAAIVTAGNRYLAEYANSVGASQTLIIPTVVDAERYYPISKIQQRDDIIIGWIGTPQTSHYLQPLLPVIARIKSKYNVRFVAVGAKREDFFGTPVEAIPWTEGSEVEAIQQFDIGIMPLIDTEWERGKCGYKLIQYMACGLPVVASPVGVNIEIVDENINGYLAGSENEWQAALERLCSSTELRVKMGQAAREKIEKSYSLDSHKQKFFSVIMRAVGRCVD